MNPENQGKTQKPTSKRKQDAEKKGDVPRSREMAASLNLLAAIFYLSLSVPLIGKSLLVYWRSYFRFGAGGTNSTADFIAHASHFFQTFILILGPLFGLLIVLSYALEVFQAGSVKFHSDRLHFNFSRLFNIMAGLKKIIGSVQSLMELLKSFIKVIAIGIISYVTLKNDIPAMMYLPERSIPDILSFMGLILLRLAIYILIFMIALAVLDYFYQRFMYMRKLKMSKQEIKDEHKQLEGDPVIKGKQRQIQYKRAIQRMMSEVPKADVVITNPTHYAIALKYDFPKMHAPKVVAKGQDLIASRIRDKARESGVPVIENPPLAQMLYKAVEIDEFIPANLFKPVAEILAYIYKLKGRRVS